MRNFVLIEEEVDCENFGNHDSKLGYSCRDHCPYCLYSKHVDKMPRDREEKCHGKLVPISIETHSKKGYMIIYKCEKCGSIRKNVMAEDDNMDLIIKLSVNKGEIY